MIIRALFWRNLICGSIFISAAILIGSLFNWESTDQEGGYITTIRNPSSVSGQGKLAHAPRNLLPAPSSSASDALIAPDREFTEDQFDRDHKRAKSQVRDPAWADRTEDDIALALRSIPYLMKSDRPHVNCGANICQASGKIILGASWYNVETATNYLNDMGFADALGQANALTDKVVLDRNSGDFTIYFSRVRR